MQSRADAAKAAAKAQRHRLIDLLGRSLLRGPVAGAIDDT
jgi:hypothetical protein